MAILCPELFVFLNVILTQYLVRGGILISLINRKLLKLENQRFVCLYESQIGFI